MKLIAVVVAVLAASGISIPAQAGKLYDFRIQKVAVKSGVAEATISMTNTSGRFLSRLDIRCEFKDGKGKTVDIGWRRYLKLAVGKTEYVVVQGKLGVDTVRKVNCNVLTYGT